MKCDELKYENLGDMMPFYPRSTLVIRKQYVDAAIDELKMEHHRERDEYIDWVNKLQKENAELKAMVTTDNSAVIARLEDDLRKTQRALWLARAKRAMAEPYSVLNDVMTSNRWVKALNKLKAKSEEYYK